MTGNAESVLEPIFRKVSGAANTSAIGRQECLCPLVKRRSEMRAYIDVSVDVGAPANNEHREGSATAETKLAGVSVGDFLERYEFGARFGRGLKRPPAGRIGWGQWRQS